MRALAVLAVALCACIDNVPTTTPPPGYAGGSCLVSTAGALRYCDYYMGIDFTPAAVEILCGQQSGAFDPDACPEGARLGVCRTNRYTSEEIARWYYAPAFDATTAQDECTTMNGTYEVAP
jgi:hypothetical protein